MYISPRIHVQGHCAPERHINTHLNISGLHASLQTLSIYILPPTSLRVYYPPPAKVILYLSQNLIVS